MSFPAPALPPTPAQVLRTPDDCFEGLADFAYPPHYSQVGGLRVAHIDEGPRDGPLVLQFPPETQALIGASEELYDRLQRFSEKMRAPVPQASEPHAMRDRLRASF